MLENVRTTITRSGVGRWYAALAGRERAMVNAAAAVVVAGIVYGGIARPSWEYRQASVSRYQQQQAILTWMQSHEAEARRGAAAGGGNAARVQDASLLALVANTAREFDIRLTRYQPEGGGGVSVVLQEQSFNDVLRWTERLTSAHQIEIIQANLDSQDEGLVNARFSIR